MKNRYNTNIQAWVWTWKLADVCLHDANVNLDSQNMQMSNGSSAARCAPGFCQRGVRLQCDAQRFAHLNKMPRAQPRWERFRSSGANPILALTLVFFGNPATMTQGSHGRAEQCTGSLLRYHDSEGKNVDFPVLPGFGRWSVWIHTTTVAVGSGWDNGKLDVKAFVKYTNSEPSWATSIDEAISLKSY